MTSISTARIVGAIVLAAAVGCTQTAPERSGDTALAKRGTFSLTPAQQARIHLDTAKVAPFNPTLVATGTVAFNGNRSTQVLAPISGPAIRVLVEPGAVVTRGQPLATVTSPDFAAAVAQYRKSQNTFMNLQRIATLDEQLFKNDALARRDLDQAQTDASAALADRDAAIQQMRSLGVEESQIEAIRDNKPISQALQAVIRAPINGTVVEKLIADGQLLQAGTTACFTIADLSTMWVMASVFPNDLKDVRVGESVDVITDASSTPIPGRVDYVASLVDPASKAVAVRVVSPNARQILRRDMFVRIAIHATHEHRGILVPTSSVLRDEQNLPFVFLVAPTGGYVRRSITLGSRVGDRYEVAAGLNPGDRVVSEGALFIQFAESQ